MTYKNRKHRKRVVTDKKASNKLIFEIEKIQNKKDKMSASVDGFSIYFNISMLLDHNSQKSQS